MARVTKMSPTVALGAYGLRPSDVYVSTTGITHRSSCGSVRGKYGPTTDADRRELVGMSWCLRCCPDLANDSAGHPDQPARHHPGCTQGEPVRVAQSWDLDGLVADLLVCGECHAQSLVILDEPATGVTS